MDEQRVEVYFDSLRPDYPEYLNALEKEALRTEVPIIRRATRDVLRYLLKTKKPARVLEVGTAIGYSAPTRRCATTMRQRSRRARWEQMASIW